MGGRREGQTYAYCTTIAYAIVFEFHTVIIPAYLPFISPAVLLQNYDGVLFQVEYNLLYACVCRCRGCCSLSVCMCVTR